MPKGIDFEEAIAVLYGRRPRPKELDLDGNNHMDTAGGLAENLSENIGCFCSRAPSAIPASLSSSLCGDCSTTKTTTSTSYKQETQTMIQSHCVQMTLKDKIHLILQLQSERVQTYRIFDQGLEMVLSSNTKNFYPDLCAHVTATFAVLSDSINTIGLVMRGLQASNNSTEDKAIHAIVETCIHRLQRWEKEKLNLTAAIHLDKIRIHDQERENHPDIRTTSLLNDSISKSRVHLDKVIENINEVLEELHALVADL